MVSVSRREEFAVAVTVAVVISVVFLFAAPLYEKSLGDTITTTHTFSHLLEEGEVEEFNQLRKDWKSKLEIIDLDVSNNDLSGVNLKSIIFTNANFAGTHLVDANLEHMVFSGTLEGANLSGATLYGAHLAGVNLDNTNLSGADMSNANLEYASLDNANLRDANLHNTDLSGADLDDTNLSGADLTYAHLEGAYLRNAILFGANLLGAHMTSANLVNANLVNANLSGTNLQDTHLKDANLKGTILSGCGNGSFAYTFEVKNLPISKEEAIERGAIYKEC